jgi:hypothetical protein
VVLRTYLLFGQPERGVLTMKSGSLLAIIVFTLVAFVHLLRLLDGTQVVVDGTVIPMWASVVGILVPGLIAFQLWREGR